MTKDQRWNATGSHRCNRRISIPLVIAFVILLCFPLISHSAESGDVIRVIEVQGLTRIDQREFIELLSFHVGDTLDRNRLGDGIRRAFQTGVFRDIQAVSEPDEGGIRMIYRVSEIPVIEKISVRGNSAVRSREIRQAFAFREGEGLVRDLIDEATIGLKRFFRERGFPDAVVRIAVAEENKSANVRIRIEVEEGDPQVITKIQLPLNLSADVDLAAGDIMDTTKVEKAMKRLRERLKKQGHIRPVVGPYKYMNGELTIPVRPGPKLALGIKQNSSVSTKELMKKLTFLEDEEVTDESIASSVERIRAFYHSKGYRHAEVAAAVSYGRDLVQVDFFIFEGEKVYVRAIRFSGNALSPDVLRSILPLKEKKPFNSELLDDGRESLIRFYNALGYLNATVSDIREEYPDDGTRADIEFVVDEGSRVVISEVDVSGNSIIGSDVIRNVLRFREGDPYNAVDIGDSRYRVQALYNRFGYLDVGVEAKRMIRDDEAFISLRITENIPSIAGKTIIRGNHRTKSKVIKREFTIEEGEPYSREEILKMKQKLYRLGLFSEVSIDILDPVSHGAPGSGEKSLVRDMLVTLKESKAGAVEFGIGYGDYEKLRGSIDITYRNIGGYNRQIGLRAEKNAVWEKYALNYREPWLFNRPNLPFSSYLKKEQREAVNLDTKDLLYKIDKISFVAGVETKLSENVKAWLNYEYSINDTSEVDPGVILSRDDTGTLGIGSVSPSIFYDTRDDPFEPTSGTLTGIALKFASRLYFSETEFIKGTFQSSWYYLLRKGLVFAVSLKGGAAYAFGATEELPLIERFFLGGRTTVRGYSNDLLGPKSSDDVPTGGNVFALINNELRFSIRKGFGVVVFLDGGNVWQLVNDIEPELKLTAGGGLRYRTPVGPVRIDYGHKLNRGRNESAGEVHFSFGHAF